MALILHDETGTISDVFVHQPGIECKIAIQSEDPNMWLFDSLLKGVKWPEWIKEAKKEHLGYVKLLQEQGIKVHYLTSLLKLQEGVLKEKLEGALNSAIAYKLISNEAANDFWKEILSDPVTASLKGINLKYEEYEKLMEAGFSGLSPKPNAYFPRDPFAIIGNLFVKLKPATWQRIGEPELWEMALQPFYEQSYQMQNISEGGDITIFNKEALVGIGTRTTEGAVKELYNIIERLEGIEGIIAIYKPSANQEMGKSHSSDPFMHLDIGMMPLGFGKFVGDENFIKQCMVTHLGNGYNYPSTTHLGDFLINYYNQTIIPSSEKEQYSLAPNVLPANGVMISADVNKETNRAMANAGLKVKTFAAKTLLSGCGSGHCMSNAVNYLSLK